jgi:signal transduction histidine kinase
MLKKLKLRLMLNNMLILAIVFFLLFAAFSVLIYIREESKITNYLEENITAVEKKPTNLPDIIHQSGDVIYNVSFVVFVDNNGNIMSSTSIQLSEEEVENVISTAIKNEQSRGNIKNIGISFLKENVSEGTLIAFVSREHLSERMKENLFQSALALFISLIVFLYISKKLADIALAPVEKAWEQQKQFLADASHDLKTPLTVILANNNIILSHQDETVESQMKWLESTREEAGRMSDLINKMLELAKGEETKDDLRIGEVDLSELVENSILQFEVVAFEKNVLIESGIQPNIIVRTHPSTFSKVLEILFDNAIKYSEPNGKIGIALYQSSKKVYFSINNHGECIKEEELPHVFERFYRTNKERKSGGHGLGLSIAKKKCDMIGCKLSVDSNEEDGTTFTIALKARRKQK